jgi:hypothetical protein
MAVTSNKYVTLFYRVLYHPAILRYESIALGFLWRTVGWQWNPTLHLNLGLALTKSPHRHTNVFSSQLSAAKPFH